MRRVSKLVDGRDALDFVAALDQDARIAGKGRDIAGHRDHERHFARRKPFGLSLRALPRRIEYHRVEIPQFFRHQRTAKQVARLRCEPALTRSLTPPLFARLRSHRHRCRRPTPAISRRGGAQTDPRRKTDRRYVWRVGNVPRQAPPTFLRRRRLPGGKSPAAGSPAPCPWLRPVAGASAPVRRAASAGPSRAWRR